MVFLNGNGNDGLLLLLTERPIDLSAALTFIILVSLNLDEKKTDEILRIKPPHGHTHRKKNN